MRAFTYRFLRKDCHMVILTDKKQAKEKIVEKNNRRKMEKIGLSTLADRSVQMVK